MKLSTALFLSWFRPIVFPPFGRWRLASLGAFLSSTKVCVVVFRGCFRGVLGGDTPNKEVLNRVPKIRFVSGCYEEHVLNYGTRVEIPILRLKFFKIRLFDFKSQFSCTGPALGKRAAFGHAGAIKIGV